MSNSLIPRAAWASAVLAAAVAVTGCSSHGGSAGGSATSAVGNATSAAATTTTASATPAAGSTGATGPANTGVAGTTAASSPSAQHSASLLPVPTTAVSAPSGGSITQTVAARTPSMLPSTALASPVKVGTATVQIKVSRINVKATAPGDVSGPALQVVTTVKNTSNQPLSTSALVVNVTDAANTPATPMTSGPFSRMATTIPAGKSATGTYVFHIGTVKEPVTATVYLAEGQPTAVFTGKV